jgi:hypothetical protein
MDRFLGTLAHLMQEIKREIIYRRMNITAAQQMRDTPMIRIQAYLISTVTKTSSLFTYQGLMKNKGCLEKLTNLVEIIRNRVQ